MRRARFATGRIALVSLAATIAHRRCRPFSVREARHARCCLYRSKSKGRSHETVETRAREPGRRSAVLRGATHRAGAELSRISERAMPAPARAARDRARTSPPARDRARTSKAARDRARTSPPACRRGASAPSACRRGATACSARRGQSSAAADDRRYPAASAGNRHPLTRASQPPLGGLKTLPGCPQFIEPTCAARSGAKSAPRCTAGAASGTPIRGARKIACE
jgi:hypothetical protein